jgi:hypothetical protein
MKKFYIIAPLALLAVFAYFFQQDLEASKIREAEKTAANARAAEDARRQKEADEQKAREDAERRAAEREAEEKKKEEARLAKWEAESKEIAAETARHLAKSQKQTEEIAALEKKLAALRAENERRVRENFDTARAIETLAIEKRNLELEAQRVTAIIAARAAASAAVVPPPPPPPPAVAPESARK